MALDHDHLTKILAPLRLLNPDFLINDWTFAHSHDWHLGFDLLAALLLMMDGTGWALVVAHVLIILLGLVCVAWWVDDLARPTERVVALLLVFLFGSITLFELPSMQWLFQPVLTPHSMASLCYLAFLTAYLKGRHVLVGLFLGVAGLLHLNFAVASLPIVALMHGRDFAAFRLRRLVIVFGPVCLAIVISLPSLLAVGFHEESARAHEVYMFFRAPHIYVTMEWLHEMIPYIVLPLSIAAGLPLIPSSLIRSKIIIAIGAHLAVIAVATLLTTVVFWDTVARLLFFRLAPHLLLLMVTLWSVMLARALTSHSWPLGPVRSVLLVTAIPFAFEGYFALLLLAGLAIVLIGRRLSLRADERALLACTFLAIAVCSSLAPKVMAKFENWPHPFAEHETRVDLYAWARAHTDESAIFVVPPHFDDFRLRTGRAIVADWKMVPVTTPEMLDWYDRLHRLAGRPETDLMEIDELFRGYFALTPEELISIAEEFDATHVVRRRTAMDEESLPEGVADVNYVDIWMVMTLDTAE